jgi:hypothetical protein
MATYNIPNLHSQAGARWLAPFMVAFLLTLLAAFAMFIYPHVSS